MLLWLLVAALLSFPVAAWPHSFYSPACCSDLDCAPVEDTVVEERADGVHVQGFDEVLGYGDSRLHWSRDYETHVCATKTAPSKLLCVYRKPSGT